MSNDNQKGRRRRGRLVGETAVPPESVTPATPVPVPADESIWAPLLRDRQLQVIWAFISLLTITFCAGAVKLARGRSFHADELTSLYMHVLRERGKNAEEQHAFYHDFYAWWLTHDFSERFARIPSITFCTLSMISITALGGRLAGRWGALTASILFFLWPRAWDDALEMRYYGLVFLAASLGMHALLSLIRGAIYIPMIVLAALAVLVVKWHPTALPWQGGAVGLGALLATVELYRRYRRWHDAPLAGRGRFPVVALGLPVSLAVVGIAAAGVAFYINIDHLGASKLIANLAKAPSFNYEFDKVWAWSMYWFADPYHPSLMLRRVLFFSATTLLLLGGFHLWRTNRALLVCLVVLLAAQLFGALLFGGDWKYIVRAPKYLTSSGVFVLLLLVLGVVECHRLASRLPIRRAPLLIATPAVVLLFIAPLVPRTAVSAFGDASHYRQFWTDIMRRSGDQVPLALVVGEGIQSSKLYRYLIDRFVIHEAPAEQFIEQFSSLASLQARRNPVYVVCNPAQVEKIESISDMEVVEEYPSNFHPAWSFVLMGSRHDDRLIGASSLALSGVTEFMPLETGNWRLEGGAATIDGTPHAEGSVVSFSAWRPSKVDSQTGQPVLVPDISRGPSRRSGGFASDAPLDAFNLPRGPRTAPYYQLSNVYMLEYDVHVPAMADTLTVELQRDIPAGGSFSLKFDRDLVGLYVEPFAPEDGPTTGTWTVAIPIAREYRGRDLRIAFSFHGENSIRKADSDEVRIFRLNHFEFSRTAWKVVMTRNQLLDLELVPAPVWTDDGLVDFRKPGSEQHLMSATDEAATFLKPVITRTDRALEVHLPRDMPSQMVVSSGFRVEPGKLLAFELEARARNVIAKNAAPSISFHTADGVPIKSVQLSQRYITSEDPDWVRRMFLEIVPPGAVYGAIGFYINSPNSSNRMRDDGRIDIRKLRFHDRYEWPFETRVVENQGAGQ